MKPLNIIIYAQWVLPIINPRSNRTWQLALNLAKMGHRVTVYALLGKYDYSEYERKYNLKIKNLGKSYLGCLTSDGEKQSIIKRGLAKILGKTFVFPDIELKNMVTNSLTSINEDIDILITIASPHTIHWGAASVLPKKNIKFWIADCGDPFMLNPFYTPPSRFEKYEREWCEKVNAITIPINEGKAGYYKEYHHKIHIIPQGFDFSEVTLADYRVCNVPTFAFSGIVYPKLRDPKNFLKSLLDINAEFKFIVYSKNIKHFEPYARMLGNKFEFRNYIPRNKLIHELSKMDFLINIKNIGSVQQPSKLIDYAQANRPILTISSNYTEDEKKYFLQFLANDYSNRTIINDINQYDIKNICKKFIYLYNEYLS